MGQGSCLHLYRPYIAEVDCSMAAARLMKLEMSQSMRFS